MHYRSNLAYVCDGTFYGLLTTVFYTYEAKMYAEKIENENYYQHALEFEYVKIETDESKAVRVFKSLKLKLMEDVLSSIYYAHLAEDENKLTNIYKYICGAINYGDNIKNLLTKSYVYEVTRLSKFTLSEAHLLKGFTRFSLLNNGVLYSNISPVNNVLEILGEHFSDRLKHERWIIHDVLRGIAAVYDTKAFVIADVPKNAVASFELAENEDDYKNLWKVFYDSITIKERKNEKLQTQLLRKRFRKHMTEFQ